MIITRHAAQRYAVRVRAASFEEAVRQLEGIAGAASLEADFENGQAWYRAGDLRLVAEMDAVVTCYLVGVDDERQNHDAGMRDGRQKDVVGLHA